MKIAVYLRDQRVAYIDGVTGDPVRMVTDIASGSYRDIFTLASNLADITYPGVLDNPTPEDRYLVLPASIIGNIIPTGNVVVAKETSDDESTISVNSFQLAISDEISHTAPRSLVTPESYWAFPFNLDGVSMFSMWRQSEVTGWGNVDANQ